MQSVEVGSSDDAPQWAKNLAHRLVQPDAMGDVFKCMALTARDWPRGAGFPEGQRRKPDG